MLRRVINEVLHKLGLILLAIAQGLAILLVLVLFITANTP